MFEPDPAKPDFSAPKSREEAGGLPAGGASGKSDFAELATKFAVHGGGNLSAELSADLALEVVLNEIAEQACVETGGSGAAIVLERGGEWICRASAGANAPELGSRLDSETGLSGACVKTRAMQRCDDAQSDPRADVEACRNLGVRSVMILPMLLNDRLVGVFEVFSALPSAFGVHEEIALGTLAQRALQNLEWASAAAQQAPAQAKRSVYPTMAELIVEDLRVAEMSRPSAEISGVPIAQDISEIESSKADTADRVPIESAEAMEDSLAQGRAIRVLTWVLGVMVLSAAVLLAVVMAHKWSGRTMARRHGGNAVRAVAAQTAASGYERSTGPVSTSAAGAKSVGPVGGVTRPNASTEVTPVSAPPVGGLAVYEKGKVIFRLPPQREADVGSGAALPASGDDSVLQRVEPVYPEEARAQGIEGAVVADVFIDRDGKVVDVKTVSGVPVLAQAVSDAVKQWVFKPRGEAMETRVTLNFRLPH
jgi:TonB family protein